MSIRFAPAFATTFIPAGIALSKQASVAEQKDMGRGSFIERLSVLTGSEGYRPSCARPSQEPRAAHFEGN